MSQGTFVSFKYKGVPMERFYADKLNLFDIYFFLRQEFQPAFDDDIYIVKITRFMNPQTRILRDFPSTNSDVPVVIDEFKMPMKGGYSYVIEGMFSGDGNADGLSLSINFDNGGTNRFQWQWATNSNAEFQSYESTNSEDDLAMGAFKNTVDFPYCQLRGVYEVLEDQDLIVTMRAMTNGQSVNLYAGSYISARLIGKIPV